MSMQLLLNACFLLLPALLYQFSHEYGVPYRYKMVTMSIFSSISIAVCLSYPFSYMPGYNTNLMLVPFLVACLYGGWKAGVFLSVVTALVRYETGMAKYLLSTLMICLLFWLVISVLRRWYLRSSMNTRIAIASGLIVLIVALLFGLYALNGVYGTWYAFSILSGIHVLATAATVFLIESYHEKTQIRKNWEKVEKLQLIGQLAASIAHEVRNPLTTVKGSLQLIREKQLPAQSLDCIVNAALEDIERAGHIINDFLSIAKPESEELQTLSLYECIEEAAAIVAPCAEESNVVVEFRADRSLAVEADKQKFMQCMLQLMQNAIEAMPDGGLLTVGARNCGSRIVVDIIDTGVGMTSEQLANLGVPHYSTKDKGTGLGLLFCYQYMKSMHGKLEVVSAPGRGARFTLSL